MANEKLLTVREVSHVLNISEKEVIEHAEKGRLPAYKVGGVYLRFKREQVEEFKRSNPPSAASAQPRPSLKDSFIDFLYFNDFYIFSFAAIIAILFFIFR